MPGSGIFSDGTTVWSSFFSDANGWASDPSYWKTIQFPDLNHDGKADVCGRASDGIYCALSNGTSFGPVTGTAIFNNANGWNGSPSRWSTIRFADVTGDDRPDACGRGVSGIWCAEYNGAGFNLLRLWSSDYGDSVSPGWWQAQYYSTLQFADLNRDGKEDICGRGSAGIYCSESTGNLFSTAHLVITDFSDAGGWNAERYYKTIRLLDLGQGTALLCGRGWAASIALLPERIPRVIRRPPAASSRFFNSA